MRKIATFDEKFSTALNEIRNEIIISFKKLRKGCRAILAALFGEKFFGEKFTGLL